MSMDSLTDLLEDEVKDLYSAENQLLKALPKMAKKATSETLKQAFLMHNEETKGHVERLTKIGEIMGIKMGGKVCKAMKGLVEEGKEIIEEDGEGSVIDAGLIGAAQRVEHYEMAGYGCAREMALGSAEGGCGGWRRRRRRSRGRRFGIMISLLNRLTVQAPQDLRGFFLECISDAAGRSVAKRRVMAAD